MNTHITQLVAVLLLGAASVACGINDAELKNLLVHDFTIEHSNITRKNIGEFKERFAVTNEQFHRVLMIIYREASCIPQPVTPETKERRDKIETGVVYLLSECGDIPVKDFLLDYAASKEKNALAREFAVASYLRVANAGEAKEVLLRFLVGEERMEANDRTGLYYFARESYENSASPEKRAAILAALATAAEKEEDKIEFMHVDRILSEKNAAYRRSRKRFAMFERHEMEPPDDLSKWSLYPAVPLAVGTGILAVFFLLWRGFRKKHAPT